MADRDEDEFETETEDDVEEADGDDAGDEGDDDNGDDDGDERDDDADDQDDGSNDADDGDDDAAEAPTAKRKPRSLRGKTSALPASFGSLAWGRVPNAAKDGAAGKGKPRKYTKRSPPMSGMTRSSAKGVAIHDGIPFDIIAQRLTEVGPEARFPIRIQRRNELNGQLQTFPRLDRSLTELYEIESQLEQLAGGGRYRIEVRNPQSMDQLVVPVFEVHVFGPPRQPRFAGSSADAAYQAQAPGPVVQGFTSPWAQNLPPQVQQQYVASGAPGAQPPPAYGPGATIASDRLAMHQSEQLRAELAEMRSELRASKEKYEEKVAQLERELAREREIARQAAHDGELAKLHAKIEALSQREPAKPSGAVEIAAALAPFAPVFSTMLSARENAASKSMEIASTNLNNLMTATLTQANKPDSFERMLPIIKELLTARKGDPKSEMEFVNQLLTGNMNNVAMMAQLVESMMQNEQGERPWWGDVVHNALESGKAIVGAYLEQVGEQRAAQAGPPQHMLPNNLPRRAMQQSQPQHQPQQSQQHQPTGPQPTLEYASDDVAPEVVAQPTDAVQSAPPTGREKLLLAALPQEFQTPAWRKIVVELHRNTDDVPALAQLVAMHIEHCIQFDMLPTQLADVRTDPASALSRVIAPLPFAQQKPEVAGELVRLVIEELHNGGWLAESEPIAEAVAEDELDEEEDAQESAGPPRRAAAQ